MRIFIRPFRRITPENTPESLPRFREDYPCTLMERAFYLLTESSHDDPEPLPTLFNHPSYIEILRRDMEIQDETNRQLAIESGDWIPVEELIRRQKIAENLANVIRMDQYRAKKRLLEMASVSTQEFRIGQPKNT